MGVGWRLETKQKYRCARWTVVFYLMAVPSANLSVMVRKRMQTCAKTWEAAEFPYHA